MRVADVFIPGVKIIEPELFVDGRGTFFESFNHKQFELLIGSPISFVQDNQSFSKKGVLRGLHYQKQPREQGKLVRCVHGRVFDVVVDLREKSPTFQKWFGIELSAENCKQMWVPEGLAHGFFAITDAVFLYKVTDYWCAESERVLMWNDRDLAIEWPVGNLSPTMSDKDLKIAKSIREVLN
ncbi:dTDP-4-dehydrorhamnose 3,5-epimerase [Jeongeupia chitinilytica]|uniref:dTDP-4-dehydrorhamnose 3,5-epimerase n=1 Tax=Jeongeupia chitinilytica TaxID=1041641 RepID=A0ABQ3H2S6_9NEIS|nr:dTDP-4-dehydrorhamnose 3,5-epimerase [Jeongeupia chitinilytica]